MTTKTTEPASAPEQEPTPDNGATQERPLTRAQAWARHNLEALQGVYNGISQTAAGVDEAEAILDQAGVDALSDTTPKARRLSLAERVQLLVHREAAAKAELAALSAPPAEA